MRLLIAICIIISGTTVLSKVSETISYGDQYFLRTEIYREVPVDGLQKITPDEINQQRLSSVTLNAGANLAGNPDALAAFNRAIDVWKAWFDDPVSIEVDADLVSLGGSYLGAASSNFFTYSYDAVRDDMVSDANPTSEAICFSLPTLAEFGMIIPSGFTFYDDNMRASKANFRALGYNMNFDPNPDVIIQFNLDLVDQFDFDRSDGIDPDKYDFEGIVTHELGHALGFSSEVTYVDYYLANKLTAEVSPRPLDLFRLQPGDGATDFTNAARVLVPANYPGGTSIPVQVTYDGANELMMSTGDYSGDGRQASHWKDDSYTGELLGLMDPTLGKGLEIKPMRNDIVALGLVGWDIGEGPCPGTPFDCNNDGIGLTFSDLNYFYQYLHHTVSGFDNPGSYETNFYDNPFFPCEPTYSDFVAYEMYLNLVLPITDLNQECVYTEFPQKSNDLEIVLPTYFDLSTDRSEVFTIQLKNNTDAVQYVRVLTVPIEFPYSGGTGTAVYSFSNFRDYGLWTVDENISASGKPAVAFYSTTDPVAVPPLSTIDLFDVSYDWIYESGTPSMEAAFFYEAPACVPMVTTETVSTRSPIWREFIPNESYFYYDCDSSPGEINGIAPIDILDIVYLINNIYKDGPDPVGYPLANADVDGDCTKTILDIVLLINFKYKGGPPPITCPDWVTNCGPLR